MKRIMSEKKTTLPFLRDQNWRTVKSKTEKMDDLLKNIPTNIIDLNDLIHAGAKLAREKIAPSGKPQIEFQNPNGNSDSNRR